MKGGSEIPNPKSALKKVTPKDVSKIRILDPACGSGSFLIGAFQYLIDWHLQWYSANDPESWTKEKNPPIFDCGIKADPTNSYRLTTTEKKRILLNNIYGVDIDPQAVEVTKLSLLLKVLEGESDETLSKQLKLFHERALPDLGNNIKCGNSLIGPDFYNSPNGKGGHRGVEQQLFSLNEEERYRINVFDWNAEFYEIMKAGGFDAVIGNPPYIRIQALKEWAPVEVEFYKQRYDSAKKGNYDIYVVFVEKGLSLLNSKGILGFILPHKFFNAHYGEPLRTKVSKGKHLAQVVHFGDQQIFEGATTYTCLMFLSKSGFDHFRFIKVNCLHDWRISENTTEGNISASNVTSFEWNFNIGKDADLFKKLNNMSIKLGDIAHIFVGLQTSADTVFLFKDTPNLSKELTQVYSKELKQEISLESDLLKPVVRSGEIGRFWAKPTAHVLFPYQFERGKSKLIPESEMMRKYPNTYDYLTKNKFLLANREHGKFKSSGWYQLYPKNLDLWEQPKILIPYMITNLSAYCDRSNLYFVNVTTGGFGITIHSDTSSLEYFTGLLNSCLLDWFLKQVSTTFHGGYFAANKQFLAQAPY